MGGDFGEIRYDPLESAPHGLSTDSREHAVTGNGQILTSCCAPFEPAMADRQLREIRILYLRDTVKRHERRIGQNSRHDIPGVWKLPNKANCDIRQYISIA